MATKVTLEVEITDRCRRHVARAERRMERGDELGALASVRRAKAAMRLLVNGRCRRWRK